MGAPEQHTCASTVAMPRSSAAEGKPFPGPVRVKPLPPEAAPFGPLIAIPARSQAIISNVSFGGACDPLTYGYQLGGGPTVQVDSMPFACPYTEPVDGATIGPFATPTVLRIVLEGTFCGGGPDRMGFVGSPS